jgi:formylglycine-generating enzyme required for sulfatase activity
MKNFYIVFSIVILSATVVFAQSTSCYETTRSKGIAEYNKGNYDRAIKYFELARNSCDDTPNNNDLQTYINRCKTAKKQKAENEAEQQRQREAEQRRRKEQQRQSQQSIDIPMVYVSGGTFTMGCTSEQGGKCRDNERFHQVTLSGYYIGKYEVTQAQWRAVMDSNPSNFKGDNLPVESVSWHDVQDFIRKLNQQTGKNYRLPTEAEWEFAARGGNSSRGYKYSGSNDIGSVAWYNGNSGGETHPVGTKQANELGIYDMTGNVWEWCNDWYGSYSGSSQTNPKGASSGSYRVLRGGSWYSNESNCRVSNRSHSSPDSRLIIIGFRVAVAL